MSKILFVMDISKKSSLWIFVSKPPLYQDLKIVNLRNKISVDDDGIGGESDGNNSNRSSNSRDRTTWTPSKVTSDEGLLTGIHPLVKK